MTEEIWEEQRKNAFSFFPDEQFSLVKCRGIMSCYALIISKSSSSSDWTERLEWGYKWLLKGSIALTHSLASMDNPQDDIPPIIWCKEGGIAVAATVGKELVVWTFCAERNAFWGLVKLPHLNKALLAVSLINVNQIQGGWIAWVPWQATVCTSSPHLDREESRAESSGTAEEDKGVQHGWSKSWQQVFGGLSV